MASTSESASDGFMEKNLTCSICMDMFINPVTTPCGHSFCKRCLDISVYLNNMCPLCKKYLSKAPEVNIVLRDIVQQMKTTISEKYSGVDGEVVCDICSEPKLKARKSCLMCLTSYCSNHLENHSSSKRLRGHKLVEPVKNLDERACLTHGRPLELYSRNQQRCICVRCIEEGQEEVVSAEDEWDNKKAQLANTKTELQQKITRRQTKIDEISAALKSCKDQIENEWWDIEAVFTAVLSVLEAAQAKMLKPLDDRKKSLEKEATDLKDELEAEIKKLETTVSELDDISAFEDHILFLQRYPSISLQDKMKDWTEVELDTSLTFGTMREVITTTTETVQQELEKLASIELKRFQTFAVDVTLDPNTSHQRLVLSDDGKEVKDGGEDQEVADAPERFDVFGSILGLNTLTSGKSYWEVEVGNKTGWDLGVARDSANRKGKLTLSPDDGYWVLVHYEEENYAAMTAPPIRLSLKDKPKKVGVFVDYDQGLVSFYDVTAQSHIYTFKGCSFKEDLHPYFSPHMVQDEKNAEPLVIYSREVYEMFKEWKDLCSISI